MRNRDGNTKEEILEAALELFSIKGFKAVSIRDIGKTVGIKESTIYYYFINKQDIFDTLLLNITSLIEGMKARFDKQFEATEKMVKADFIGVGHSILFGFYLDQKIYRFMRMLIIEQTVNETASKVYHRIFIDIPLEQYTKVFQQMIDRGYFRQDDASCLSSEYYSLIYFVFHKYFSNSNTDVLLKAKAEEELTLHLTRFYDRYSN